MEKPIKAFLCLLFSVVTAGCMAESEPLEMFFAETEDYLPKHELAELSSPQIFNPLSYTGSLLRDPFRLPGVSSFQSVKHTCSYTEQSARFAEFAGFDISQLQMKGIIGSRNKRLALVLAPGGEIKMIGEGSYMGSSKAHVFEVTDKVMRLETYMPDEYGCWERQEVTLTLTQALKQPERAE